jgi:hypothetical protein
MIDIHITHFLFAFIGMLLGLLAALLGAGRMFVQRSYCEQVMKHCAEMRDQRSAARLATDEEIKRELQQIKKSMDALFDMLRAIVAHMELSPDQREKILNRR